MQSSRKLFKLAGQKDQWIVWIDWPPMIFTGPLKYIIESLIKTISQSDFLIFNFHRPNLKFTGLGLRTSGFSWRLWMLIGPVVNIGLFSLLFLKKKFRHTQQNFQLYDGGQFLLIEKRTQIHVHHTMYLGRDHRPSASKLANYLK
jgi:hypothetical protein